MSRGSANGARNGSVAAHVAEAGQSRCHAFLVLELSHAPTRINALVRRRLGGKRMHEIEEWDCRAHSASARRELMVR